MSEMTIGDVLRSHGGSVKTGPFGTVLKASEYVTQGAPVISVGEVGYGSIRVHESTPRVGPQTVGRLSEYVLNSGDIVFGRKGAVDRSAWVREHEAGFFLGSDGIRLRLGNGVDSQFVAYQLQSSTIRNWLLQHAAGTTMASLNQGTIERIPIRLPAIEEQRGIAEVLGALDDKIAASERLVTSAEALASTLYRRAIRDGDEVPLSSLARFVNGRAFTKDASGTGRVVIRIAELNSGIGSSTVYNDIDVADDNLARPGDLLFAWSGSLTVHRWYRPEAIVNQHIFKVVADQGHPLWLVHQALMQKLQRFRAIAANKATTMGHIQRHHLDEEVAVPDDAWISEHNHLMQVLWGRVLAAEVETLRLASTRDSLLPLLMSGKVTVQDAETVVEEVL